MKYGQKIIYVIIVFIIFSCASSKKHPKCTTNKIVVGNLSAFQKGYSLNLPENWITYNDIHCDLAYTPISFSNKIGGLGLTSVHVFDKNNLIQDEKIKNIDDLTNKTFNRINSNHGKPEISTTKLNHEKYGNYTTIKYRAEILGNVYIIMSVNYLYRGNIYKISFSSLGKDFGNYIQDFIKIVDSFEIVNEQI